MNFSSLALLIYLFKVKPLTSKYLNFIEIFNELILYGCTGLIVGMSDYQNERQEDTTDEKFSIMFKDKQN